MIQLEFGLDDKEFDLPTVQKLPTLESILNEVSVLFIVQLLKYTYFI